MKTRELERSVGQVLRGLRIDAQLTQGELAARVKVHVNTISNYERGQGIDTGLLAQVCRVLKQDAGEVLKAAIEEANGG